MRLPVAILAGGLATRLRPITQTIPKALVEVAGRPFVSYQLELLREAGFFNVVLLVGHLGELLEETLGDGAAYGVHLRYSYDGPSPLGTGGAVRRALPLLGDAFLVLYGDSYLECDYGTVEAAFLASGRTGLMTVYRNGDRWDRSNVAYADGRILQYDKVHQIADMRHIDYGLGAFCARAFTRYPADCRFDLADVYQHLLVTDDLGGFEVTHRFYEIGSPDGLEETRRYLAAKARHEERTT